MKNRPAASRVRPQFEEIEPRILYSADAGALLNPDAITPSAEMRTLDLSSTTANTNNSTQASNVKTEIAFVNAGIRDYQTLVADIQNQNNANKHLEVVLLNDKQDGVQDILNALKDKQNISAIHLIGEGTEAEMHLGGSFLTADSINNLYVNALKEIGSHLSADADILIYGCNFGRGEVGQAAIADIASLTGADVAASIDRTGHTTQFANWNLEYNYGVISTDVVVSSYGQQNWFSALSTFTVSNTGDSGANTLRQAIIDANANLGADNIVFTGFGIVNLVTMLPDITDTVYIDGNGSFTTPNFAINGGGVIQDGLRLYGGSNGSSIEGLFIYNFTEDGIDIAESNSNTINGNRIGIDVLGVSAGNGNGVNIWNANNNIIGGTTAADRNIISGNNLGIYIGHDVGFTSTGNQILGNYIGTNVSGASAISNVDGIYLQAAGNTIGGLVAGARNVISGNSSSGIVLSGTNANNNVVEGNYIGTDATGTLDINGTVAVSGQSGVIIVNGASDNLIGGTGAAARNIISGNNWFGVEMVDVGTNNNNIQGNYIGTDVTGTVALGNSEGGASFWDGAANNTIGGNVAGALNLISGNLGMGVLSGGVTAPTGNNIKGNYIGTDVTGTLALDNGTYGVNIESGTNTTIGGTSALERNIISGNGDIGIYITGADSNFNTILGNYIGTNVSGTAALGNGGSGVSIDKGASNNIVGGSATGARNIVSGNNDVGIYVSDATTTGNKILGNYIGLNGAGDAAISNGAFGIAVDFSAKNTQIGGAAPGEGNVISGNTGTSGSLSRGGIYLYAESTTVQGNIIGLSADKSSIIANGGVPDIGGYSAGINIPDATGNTIIGGTSAGEANTIAGNIGDGIGSFGINVAILGNSIYSNTALGIDLAVDSITPNDVNDLDGLQNYPVLISAVSTPSDTIISGTLNTIANTTYRIEFFSSPSGNEDASGYGEGKTYLGYKEVTTDGTGNATISTTLLGITLVSGDRVTATATEKTGASSYSSTSEFAMNVIASFPNAPPAGIDGSINVTEDTDYVFTLADFGFTDVDGNNLFRVNITTLPTQGTLKYLGAAFSAGNYISLGSLQNGEFTYSPPTNANGNALTSFTFQIQDDGGTANGGEDTDQSPNTLTINISPVNDAPSGVSASLFSSISEDDINSAGQLVSDFTASTTDPDTGALAGIAIYGADNSNGQWQFTVNSGTNWVNVGAVSANNSLLLASDALTRVRFVPNANYNGLVFPFSYRAWDQTTGVVGGYADSSTNGGSSAFSTVAASVSIAVSPVNDAPDILGTLILGTNPNQALVFSSANNNSITISDIDVAAGIMSVQMSILNGTLTLSQITGLTFSVGDGTSDNSMTFEGSLDDINAALEGLSYQPTNGYLGIDTLSISVNDLGNTGSGGALNSSYLLNIIVNNSQFLQGNYLEVGINSTGSIGALTPAPVGFVNAGSSLGVIADNGRDGWTTYNGDFILPGAPVDEWGVNINGITSYNSTEGLVQQISGSNSTTTDNGSTQNVTWSGATTGLNITNSYSVSRTDLFIDMNVTLTNTTGSAMTDIYYYRNVDPDNNANTSNIYETTNTIISQGDDGSGVAFVSATQADGSFMGLQGFGTNAHVAYGGFSNINPIDAYAGTGGLSSSGSQFADAGIQIVYKLSLAAGESVTLNMRYCFDSQQAPKLDLDANDSNSTGSGYQTTYVENAAPVKIADTDATVKDIDSANLQSMTATITNLLDGANEILSADTTGTLITASYNNGVLTLSGSYTVANYEQVLKTITYQNTSENPSSTQRIITIVANDGVNNSNIATSRINVTPVNDAPTTSAVTLTVIAEDSDARLITQAELLANAADVDGPSLTATGLTIASGSGSLVNNGNGTWTYTPALNDDTAVSFSYTVTDGSLTAAGSATLDITPVNDAPTTSAVTLTAIAEDSGARLITQAELLANAADVDGPSLTATGLTIASGSGSLVDNGDGTWSYTPALNDDTSVSFSYTVTDGSLTAAGTASLDITPVNDAPVNAVPGAQSTNEDTNMVFSSANSNQIAISDLDAGSNAVEVTVSVTNGALTLASTMGLTFTGGDGTADTTMTFRGTVTDINTALNGLSFAPSADYNGGAVLTVSTKDSTLLSLDVDTGLVGRYGFESSGALGTDTSPAAGNTGTAVNATPVVDGTRGNVLSLDGNSYLQIAGNFGNPANVTLAAWINATSLDPNGAMIIALSDVQIKLSPSGTLEGWIYNGSGWEGLAYSGAGDLSDSSWHHVAFSFNDPGNGYSLYLDGVNVASGTTTSSISYSLAPDSFIGKAPIANFIGNIDEARIYNRVLTTAEIATLASDLSMTDTDTVAITVMAVNDEPTNNPLTLAPIAEDSGARLITQAELLANAADVDGPSLTATGLTIASGSGSLVDNGDGTWSYTPALNDDTSVSFSYTVTDGSLTAAGTASLDITPVNDAPTTSAVTLTAIAEDSGARLITQAELLANAADVDGPSLTATGLTIASGSGSLVDNGDGTWSYTPALNDDTSVSFSYTVTDGSLTAAGSATLDITTVNDAAIITPAVSSLTETNAVLSTGGTVAMTDVDSAATFVAQTAAAGSNGYGVFNLASDGTWTYSTNTAHDEFVAGTTYTDILNITSADGTTSTITVNILGTNDAPTASNVSLNVLEDNVLNGFLPIATDAEGATVTYSLGSAATHGSITVGANGAFSYNPNLNYNGADSFTYIINDGSGGTNTYTVSINVISVNNNPTASNATINAIEDTLYSGTLPIATDIENDPITYSLNTGALHGTVLVHPDGTFTYASTANYNGADSFTFTVTDSLGGANTYNITIAIAAVNDAPTASNDSNTGLEDNSISGNVLTNDSDIEGSTLTAVLVTGPTNGSLTLNANGSYTYTYTPNANWNGTDSFTYKTNDGSADSNIANVTINVTPVNDTPTSNPVTLAVIFEDSGPRLITQAQLLANAIDVDGDTLTATNLAISAGNGVLINNNDGTWTYSPGANDDTNVNFSYTVTDGSLSTAGLANLDITPVNDAPTAANLNISALENTSTIGTLPNATDIEGDIVTYSLNTGVSHGSVIINSNGSFTYTPTAYYVGADSFTYNVDDGNGGINTYTVSINSINVNDAPTAANATFNAVEDVAYSGALPSATDLDNDPISYTLNTGALHGTVNVLANGNFTYTPSANYNGADSFTYTVSDGLGGANTYTITINIAAVNDNPLANNDSMTALEDNSVSGNVLTNDSDIEGSTLSAILVSGPTRGSLILNTDGSFTYTPNANWNGTETFSYLANDGTSNSNVATVTITITATNDAPSTSTVTLPAIQKNSGATLITKAQLLANAIDVDGDILTLTNLAIAQGNGVLVDNTNGTWSYTPGAQDDSLVSFSYQVTDGNLVATGTANMDILVFVDPTTPIVPPVTPVVDPNITPPTKPVTVDPSTPNENLPPANNKPSTPPFSGTIEATQTILVTLNSTSIEIANTQNTRLDQQNIATSILDLINLPSTSIAQNVTEVFSNLTRNGNIQIDAIEFVEPKSTPAQMIGKLFFDNKIALTSVAVSAGLVAWAAQYGILFSSVLATLPAWRNLDPVAILGNNDEDEEAEWDAADDEHDQAAEENVNEILTDQAT